MAQLYISRPQEWRMFHIPFTPYHLARSPETGLWHLVEKEIIQWTSNMTFPVNTAEPYVYRFL